MRNNTKRQKLIVFLGLLVALTSMCIHNNMNSNELDNQNKKFVEINREIKSSGFWNLVPFIIDDDGGGDYTWLKKNKIDEISDGFQFRGLLNTSITVYESEITEIEEKY